MKLAVSEPSIHHQPSPSTFTFNPSPSTFTFLGPSATQAQGSDLGRQVDRQELPFSVDTAVLWEGKPMEVPGHHGWSESGYMMAYMMLN